MSWVCCQTAALSLAWVQICFGITCNWAFAHFCTIVIIGIFIGVELAGILLRQFAQVKPLRKNMYAKVARLRARVTYHTLF